MATLTVADVARLRGTCHAAAWRWLTRNAGRHFRRVGGRRVISTSVYERIANASYVDDQLARVDQRVAELEEEVADLARRLDVFMRGRRT